MFTKTAAFYDAMYSAKDYPAESDALRAHIAANQRSGGTDLLDVACGTGLHLELLRNGFEVCGIDLDPRLLAVARERLPDVPFIEGDMRTFALGRKFDVVTCLFAAIGYMRTRRDLRRAVGTMAGHLKPGGVLLVEPFLFVDDLKLGQASARFVDLPDLKIARMSVTEIRARTCVWDFRYLVATSGGGVQRFSERHVFSLFSKGDYLEAFRLAGLETDFDEQGLAGRGLFIGLRPN